MARGEIIGELRNWNETKLWTQIRKNKGPESEDVRATLNSCMPEIQTVLTQGGTAPTDFTLHDSQHGFRVAERMAEIIAQDTLNGLSTYELAILLLSAYLHDIGMCPEQGRVIRHYTYLLTGNGNGLKDEEIERFRVWLDNLDEEVVIPLCTGTPSGETLRRAGWLIAQYCRERHVDWSVEWIDQKMAGKKFGSYMHWVDDLKAVCRSHHEGYGELISDRFEPKVVGAAAMVVHLRYLALVLRVADILEFDPERTPEVIFQHREIDPRSVTYWYKDHYISRLIDDRRITISAEPPDARIHRAVEIMTNDIEAELELARRIDDEKPMEICRFQEKQMCHRWEILPDVRRDIRPKNGAYEYIDGAFRPDTKKLLQLFSGKEMYGNEIVAVRELLQNAFDAVREQIAYERLARPNPRDGNLEEKLAEVHKVELQVEVRNGRVWLVCRDNGVGMNKAIIRDYFLVSGNCKRPDIRVLERRCEEAGIELGRTGQFGIGVLSYFMLGDMVRIRTRRNNLTGDSDACGWMFETEGVGSFGELRMDNSWHGGTEVTVRLRNEICKDVKKWFEELCSYLKETLSYLPCGLEVGTEVVGCKRLEIRRGWVRDPMDIDRLDLSELLPRKVRYVSQQELFLPTTIYEEYTREFKIVEDIRKKILGCLTWRTFSGRLPENMGKYRIHVPVFNLLEGKSSFFVDVKKVDGRMVGRKIRQFEGYMPQGKTLMSWRGMRVNATEQGYIPHLSLYVDIEIDWESADAGTLSVNRETIDLGPSGKKSLNFLRERVNEVLGEVTMELHDSLFASITQKLSKVSASVKPIYWVSHAPRETDKWRWEMLAFPVVNMESVERLGYYKVIVGLRWNRKDVTAVPFMKWTDGLNDEELIWNHLGLPPDRVVLYRGIGDLGITGLWCEEPTVSKSSYFGGMKCQFPNAWGNIAGVMVRKLINSWSKTTLWNAAHPLIAGDVSMEELDPQADMNDMKLDPRLYREKILSDRRKAMVWMTAFLNRFDQDLWLALVEHEPDLLEKIWCLVFANSSAPGLKDSPLLFYGWDEEQQRVMCVLTPKSCQVITDVSKIEQYLPDPGPEWTLEIIEK